MEIWLPLIIWCAEFAPLFSGNWSCIGDFVMKRAVREHFEIEHSISSAVANAMSSCFQ